jgi:CubicO group peptidase (beta-lactamase class C family)
VLVLAALFASRSGAQTPGTAVDASADRDAKVDALFAQWKSPHSPGCALGVIRDRRLVYARGYGMADLEHGVPITPHTAFDIASMSKQFTGMAVLLLAEQKKLSLDDDVHRYVPEVPDYGATITLRHLVHHSSGLRNHFMLRQLDGWRWGDLVTRADELATVARQTELNFRPGDEHSYANTGYFLLGEVVRRVSGVPLREFAERSIFGPLGMTDTQVHDDDSLLVPGRACAYNQQKDGSWVNNITRSEDVGASNVYTSIEDLARWDRNFYDATVGGPAVIAHMLEPGTLNDGRKLAYAAGLRLGTYKGLKLVWHAGSSSSRSEYLRFPDQRFSVICLANTGAIDPSDLARRVADIYLADLLKPEPAPAPPSPEADAKGRADVAAFIDAHAVVLSSADAEKLPGLAGLYVNPDDGSGRRVRVGDGKLLIEKRRGGEGELVPIGGQRFVMADIPMRLEYSFLQAWPDVHLLHISTGEGTPLALIDAGADPALPKHLEDYAGTFRNDDADAMVTMAVHDGALVLRTKGSEVPVSPGDAAAARGWYPLKPLCVDSFFNDWMGFLRFTRDAKQQIQGFVICNFAGGVRHLPFRKGEARFGGGGR